MNKRIITCAITGASFTPTMSPYLPYKPEDIISQAIEAHKAGAAICIFMPETLKQANPVLTQCFLENT